MKTFAIRYGWSGGRWSNKRFVMALKNAGFKESNEAESADIIFAHSAGCYQVPQSAKASLVVIHDPPYWPGRSLLIRLLHKKATDTRHIVHHEGLGYTLAKFFWEGVYVFKYPSKLFITIRQNKKLTFLERLSDKRILLIRNHKDSFCTPNIKQAIHKYRNISYAEVDGLHDDYFTNPQPYIDLILKHL